MRVCALAYVVCVGGGAFNPDIYTHTHTYPPPPYIYAYTYI